jgi:hypothetical protein
MNTRGRLMRRLALEKERKRNPVARSLNDRRYRQRRIESKSREPKLTPRNLGDTED